MAEPADLIISGADVFTVDAARTWADAIAIRGDRIVAVGTEDEVRDQVGAGGEHLHLAGRMVVPGFQDSHIHAAFGARNLLNVNLDDLYDRDAYLGRIRSFAAANPDLPWIVGGGWYNTVFGEAGPRASDLDAVVPDRPVFLFNTDVHAGWVNSKTLEIAGWTADTPDPFDGYFVRYPDGSPTGCLQEGTAYTVLRDLVPAPDVEEWTRCLRRAQEHLTAFGITGWQDAWVEPDLLSAYRALDDAGELAVRVVTSLWWDRHRGMEQIDGLLEGRERGTGGRVNAGTVKIMLDGCPETATGAMLEPYEGAYGAVHGTGLVFVDDEMLREAVARLDAEGFQIHQHALGDRAIRSALDAIQTARHMNGMNDQRHHIAHLQLPDPADVPRLRELGVIANMQPYWGQPDPMVDLFTRPRVGERAERLYPIGSLRASGAVMAFGSDWPVSTPNVLHELDVAVNRESIDARDRGALHPEEGIDLVAALAAFTRGTAYLNHDDEAGMLAPGMRADLAVIDRNLFDRSLGAIADATVEMTIASGSVVFGG
ncbi:MAG: amidohydrolase [Actinomycetota bacterium]